MHLLVYNGCYVRGDVMYMSTLLSSIKGVGPKKFDKLNKLGLHRVNDFIDFYPKRYIDRRNIMPLSEILAEMICSVRVVVVDISVSSRYGKKELLRIKTSDGQFFMDVYFFNARYVSGLFKLNKEYIFYGKVTYGSNGFSMTHPDFTQSANPSDDFLKIQPVYSLTEGLSQKDMNKISKKIFSDIDIDEILPPSILLEHNLCSREKAVNTIHFPEGREDYRVAKYRLVFEEFDKNEL